MELTTDSRARKQHPCRQRRAGLLLAAGGAVALQALGVAPPAAQASPLARCGRAILAAHNRVIATDVRLLARCTRNMLEERSEQATEDACSRLRTAEIGSDRADRNSRARILRRCAAAQPLWLPESCLGPGPLTGVALGDAEAVADCVTSSGHCLAVAAVESLLGEHRQALAEQHPDNLAYEFHGASPASFASCLDQSSGSTTTSSTTTSTVATATTTTTSTTLAQGVPRLVITEIMSNPAAQNDSVGEYFEIWNGSGFTVNLEGAVVRDLGSNAFRIEAPLVVAPEAYAVLARADTAAGGIVDYVYGSAMTLSNSGDAIIIELGDVVIDQVLYDGSFPLEAGRAMELAAQAHDSTANDLPASWCTAAAVMADGDFGTPGFGPSGCPQ